MTERRNLDQDLAHARLADHEERAEAARTTGSLRSAVSSLVSKVRGVEDRAATLPELIWSVSIRVNELEAEHAAALVADLEEPKNQSHREFLEADEARQDLLDRTMVLTREQSAAERIRSEASARAEALKRSGPES